MLECETCGYTAPRHDKYGQEIMRKYNGSMLCSTCRVDQRLADGDFSNE